MKAFIRYTFEDGHVEDEDQYDIEESCKNLNALSQYPGEYSYTPLSLMKTRMYNRITRGNGYWVGETVFIHSKIVKGEIVIDE